MDNKRNKEIKLSDEMVATLDNLSKKVKAIPQIVFPEINIPKINIPEINIPEIIIPEIPKGAFDTINNTLEKFKKDFEKVSKRITESENKREENFYHTREEWSYKYGARHWSEFKEWYYKCVMLNPAYYDLSFWCVMNATDENKLHTDPDTNTIMKLIGVNSVSYELFYEYKEKFHEAQKQGLKWSYEEEKKRIEKFIKEVKVEQPVQLQDADETVKEKVQRVFNEKDAKKFFSNRDFIAFTDALATHLSGEEYILPQPITLKRGGITKIAKAVYDAFLSTKGTYLSEDIKLFDLMRVLSFFAKKTNKEIVRDMTRTK